MPELKRVFCFDVFPYLIHGICLGSKLGPNMATLTMWSFLEMSLYGLLLALFLVFFGIPSVKKYQSKETIILSSRKFTNGIEAPAVTLIALNKNTGYGWKTKSNQTSSQMGWYTNTFLLDRM